jgi:hypothetical protein
MIPVSADDHRELFQIHNLPKLNNSSIPVDTAALKEAITLHALDQQEKDDRQDDGE